jgi:putative ABC transport system permease protein
MANVYLKSAYRSLARNRNYTIINIIGLSLGMCACLLIGLFVYNESSFDSNIPHSDQIYRLTEFEHYDGAAPQLSASIGPPIAGFLKDNYSEIESYTRVLPATPNVYPSITLEYEGKKIKTNNMACVDTAFASLFNIRLLEGDKKNFISTANGIVLTQSLEKKLFGNASALNKILRLHTGDTTLYVAVTNVMADMPKTSHLQVEGLLPVPKQFQYAENYGVLLGPAYLRLRKNTDVSNLQNQLTKTIHTKNKGVDMRLQPLKQIHTGSTDINFDTFDYKKTDSKYITIFVVIALSIFLIGCINFINLTIAIAGYRGKEIAVRKIIGAKRLHVVLQILAEAFLSVLAAITIAIIMAAILLPYLNVVLDRDLSVASLYQPGVVAVYILALLLTTLIAGIYPAWLISSSKVSKALRTKVLFTGSRGSLRNILVTGQFIIAIVFITSLIVILQQLRFLQQKDLGYSYNQVIRVPLDVQSALKLPVMRGELLKIKGVADITTGYTELGTSGGPFGVDYTAPGGEHKHVSVNLENAAPNYTSFFGIKIVQGQSFDKVKPQNEYLINETFAKQIGYANPVGKQLNLSGGWPLGVIRGVVKDFNYSSLHDKIEPLLISSVDFVPTWQSQLYIKISTADIPATLRDVESTLKKVSGDDGISYEFMDEHFNEIYHSERQASTMIAIVGGLTILIACMGLFGLSAFVALRRSKEISIRKVLGATVMQVTASLSREFLLLILVSITIGAPIAWLMMQKWLQNFAYHITIHWWVFALSGSIAILIAAIVISFQSIKAALANPVKGLRSE